MNGESRHAAGQAACGGCGESQVKSAAFRCLLTEKKNELIEVSLLDDLGTKGGDVCGGTMRLFVEKV